MRRLERTSKGSGKVYSNLGLQPTAICAPEGAALRAERSCLPPARAAGVSPARYEMIYPLAKLLAAVKSERCDRDGLGAGPSAVSGWRAAIRGHSRCPEDGFKGAQAGKWPHRVADAGQARRGGVRKETALGST